MERTVVVTGAARGIGRSIAAVLADSGWQVVVCDLAQQDADAACAEIGGVAAVGFDLADLAAVVAGADTIVSRVGEVDALVNNAGWSRTMPFAESDAEYWTKVIATNLLGPMALTHALLPGIRKNAGRIVNIGSAAGKTGAAGQVPYSATKGGVMGFTFALARELAADKVTVNVVLPGVTETPLQRIKLEQHPKWMDGLRRATPLARAHDRIGQPEDIAHAVAFLLSPQAEWITGQALSVDGGLTIG